jgi:hypothetical protein
VWCAVRNPKTERLQEGAAPSAFEKRTESGREGHLSRRRQCVSAALGQHAMAHMSLRWVRADGALALALVRKCIAPACPKSGVCG